MQLISTGNSNLIMKFVYIWYPIDVPTIKLKKKMLVIGISTEITNLKLVNTASNLYTFGIKLISYWKN